MNQDQLEIPIQPVERPILCNPYEEPDAHWVYDTETGEAKQQPGRRAAGYWYKTQRTGSQQLQMRFIQEEQRDDLPLVNALRNDVIPFLTDYIALAVLSKYGNEVIFAIADFGYFPRIWLNCCCICSNV